MDPPVGEAPGEDLDGDEHLLGGGAAVVAVLGDAEAEPVVGGQDHPAAAEQDPWPGDLDLAVAGRWRGGPPALPADAAQRLVAGAAAVQDVPMIGGQHHDAARLGGRVQ